jgi:hypothetical protein
MIIRGWWLLVAILLVAISCSFLGDYWWLLVVIGGYFLVSY